MRNPEETGQVINRHSDPDTENGRGEYTRGKAPGVEYRTALHDGLRRDTDSGTPINKIVKKLGQADRNTLQRQYPADSVSGSIRSWQANNSTPDAATHADPGKPAEPVTPAVVAKAVKKSAAKTPRTPKGARQLLLRKIDAAIASAVDLGEPPARMRGDTDTGYRNRVADWRKSAGTVTFEVPGDGRFTVVNSKDRLAEFRKQVERSPGFAEKGSKPAGPQPARTTVSADERAKVMAEAETVEEGSDPPAATPVPDTGPPIQTDADRAELERRAAELEPRVNALTEEQARAGAEAIGGMKAADRRDPKAYLLRQHPDDIEEALKAAEPKPDAKPKAKKAAATPASTEGTGDYGAELTRNLRNSLGRALNWEDVAGLNSTLKAQQVVKSKVWPRPDYAALVQDGAEVSHVRALKQVYDAVAAKPRGINDTALQSYVDGMKTLRERALAYFLDPDHQNLDIGQLLRDRPFIAAMFPAAPGATAHGRFRGDSDQAKANNRLAMDLGGNKFIRGIQFDGYDLRRHAQDIAAGWPAPQEAWEKSYELHRSEPGTVVVQDGQRRTLTEPEYFVTRKGRRSIEAGPFTNRDQAVEAARGLVKRGGAGGVKPEEVVKLERAVRTGAPVRAPNEDISSERLAQTFGFRGINFGNWMQGNSAAAERQAHLNHAYDSFQDLAAVMGVPPRAMSLDGMLGLAFGAQGRKGAAAHFVPGVNEINLTREHGAGSLAHEWAHALDHYFAVQAGERTARDKVPFLTEHGQLPDTALAGVRPEVREAFRSIVKAMNLRSETPAERDARVEAGRAKAIRNLNGWIAQFERLYPKAKSPELDQLFERLRRGDVGEGRIPLGTMRSIGPTVAQIRDVIRERHGRAPGPEDLGALNGWATSVRDLAQDKPGNDSHVSPAGDLKLTETDFVKEAKLLDGGAKNAYFNTDLEKFARAFQSYAMDKLARTGGRNDYLTRPQMDEATTKVAKEMGLLEGDRYPRGVEREAINAAFDTLVGDLRTRETAGGNVGLFSRPDTEVRTVRAERATDAPDALWDKAKAFYNDQLQGKSVAAPDGEVRFTSAGRGKVLRLGSRDPLRMGVLRQLEAIAKVARVYNVAPGRDGDTARYAYAAAPVEVDGTTYAVRMVYKIPAGETTPRFYTFEGYEILGEAPAGRTVGLQDLVNQFNEDQFTFSRPAGERTGYVDTGVMDAAVRKVMGQWRGDIPTVRVVTLAEELPAQAKAASGWESAEGWYDGHNRIYLVANNLPNVTRGLQVLAHEALGHYGVEAVMGKADWTRVVGDVAKLRRRRDSLPADMQAAMDSTVSRYGTENAATFAREFLAVMAERGVKSTLTARVLAAVRRWMRSMGFPVDAWADAEVRQIVADGARAVTQRRRQRQETVGRGPALSERAGPFHSALVEAVEKAQGAPRKADAKAWKGWLDGAQRRGEFKQAERDWLELDRWLDAQTGAVTRDQIASYVSANQVRIEEVSLGGEMSDLPDGWSVQSEDGEWLVLDEDGEVMGEGASRADAIQNAQDLDESADITRAGGAKFGSYQLPGGKNYRELLLTMPPRLGASDRLTQLENDRLVRGLSEDEWSELRALRGDSRREPGVVPTDGTFRSSHWDQPNVLAHVRFNERTDADGKRVLFIEEIQSDFGQATRKSKLQVVQQVKADFEGIVDRMKAAGVLAVECD